MSPSSFKTEALETLVKQFEEELKQEREQASIVLEALAEARAICQDERLGDFPFSHSLLIGLTHIHNQLLKSIYIKKGKWEALNSVIEHANSDYSRWVLSQEKQVNNHDQNNQ